MKLIRILVAIAAFALVGVIAWRVLQEIVNNPSHIVDVMSAIFILALPLYLSSAKWAERHLTGRPQLFWLIGGGMLALSIIFIGGFVSLAMKYPSLPVDGTTFGRLFVLMFGAGFMILLTPTIYAITNALKRPKEKQ